MPFATCTVATSQKFLNCRLVARPK